jgi:hypothetical protein
MVMIACSRLCIAAENSPSEAAAGLDRFIKEYCIDCHRDENAPNDLRLDSLDTNALIHASQPVETIGWESIRRRIAARQMPPADATRPSESEFERAVTHMDQLLENNAQRFVKPGRTESLRRLNRTEYQNAIRDLLALEVDVTHWLPPDESSHGFDNVTVSALPATLLQRYLTAAEAISRMAVGNRQRSPGGMTFRFPADLTQESHIEGLPLGTRGGGKFRWYFPQTGEYEFQIRLFRDRDEHVEGLRKDSDMDVLIDRAPQHRFSISAPKNPTDHTSADSHLNVRLHVTAGMHDIVVTFPNDQASLLEQKRQPFDASYNRHRHPRRRPAISEVSIAGPFNPVGSGETDSRKKIFGSTSVHPGTESESAQEILTRLLRIAYRREPSDADLEVPMRFFHDAMAKDGFEPGIQAALSAILVNPNFLLRVERDPPHVRPQEAYWLDPNELASRISFFLWSSLPDQALREATKRHAAGHDSQILVDEVQRMLRDDRAVSMVSNFASQWLYLRNLDTITPDLRLFPDFDDNLRQSFRRETELLFEEVMRQDLSVLELIDADYSFLNERLAVHYGIPHVQGSHFRKVALDPATHRGGILRHGSILTVTSYATRTSPTIRGSWVLRNILGTPPPPPPPNVPPLPEKATTVAASVRERLAVHRENPVCASCHDLIDPVGFALEQFDAVGRWRTLDDGKPIDSTGSLPDGRAVSSVDELELALVQRPETFVATIVENLLTYGLGRGIEPSDGPVVRRIVGDAKRHNYRFSSLISGIVTSIPFVMRTAGTSNSTGENTR